MKKFLKKVRDWLIHKLGGLTQEDMKEICTILDLYERDQSKVCSTEKVFSELRLPVQFIHDNDEHYVASVVLNKLTEGIYEEMAKKHLITFESTDSHNVYEKIFRGYVTVVRSEI